MWDLIVSVPDHCLSFYSQFPNILILKVEKAQKYRFHRKEVILTHQCPKLENVTLPTLEYLLPLLFEPGYLPH